MKMIVSNPGYRMHEIALDGFVPMESAVEAAVRLTDETDQTMLGFGNAMTESAVMRINALSPEKRQALLEEVFSPEQMNFNMSRICVGASDYAETVYDFAPVANDLSMEHFDCSHDAKQIIPMLRDIRKINPDVFLFSSPWSPPGWMKTTGRMQGGFMLDQYLEAYALYYLKFLDYYRQNGVEINAMTPQNESETDQTSNMPACYWHPESEMRFSRIMRRLLDENDFADLKIWLLDHNYVMWQRANYYLQDEDTRKAVTGIAWHPYDGDPAMVSWVRECHPEIQQHWTEGDADANNSPVRNNLGFSHSFYSVARSYIDGINNGIQSITAWNLALDEHGWPNVGPFLCEGSIVITNDGQIRRSPQYYAMCHLSKFVKRGAKRIVTEDVHLPKCLSACAFVNPDGQQVVYIANSSKRDRPLNLLVGDQMVKLWILRDSATTVVL